MTARSVRAGTRRRADVAPIGLSYARKAKCPMPTGSVSVKATRQIVNARLVTKGTADTRSATGASSSYTSTPPLSCIPNPSEWPTIQLPRRKPPVGDPSSAFLLVFLIGYIS